MQASSMLHPDHDLAARRRRAFDRHWAGFDRSAPTPTTVTDSVITAADAKAAPEPPLFWQPSGDWLRRQAHVSRGIDVEMISRVKCLSRRDLVDAIDCVAVSVRAIETGDVDRARDRLAGLLDDVWPGWRATCPW